MQRTALDLVIDRFANIQKTKIEHLYREDATFYEICQDYAECVRMRDKYAGNPAELEAPHYERDYETLIEALEEEMRFILSSALFADAHIGGPDAMGMIAHPSSRNENHYDSDQHTLKTILSIQSLSLDPSSMNQEDENA